MTNKLDVSKALVNLGNGEEKQQDKTTPLETQFIEKILVPVDFSSASLNAACYAAHVAHQKGAEISLIHVYFNPIADPVACDYFYTFPTSVGETLNEIIENARDLMHEFRGSLDLYLNEHKFSDITVYTELAGGIAEEGILDFADTGKFDLLIVGVQGKGDNVNWVGNFKVGIINKSRIPILAIPDNVSYKESMFKRLAYATNFDKSDGKAIRELLKIASPLEVHICVVHISDSIDNPFINYDLAHFREKYVGDVDQISMDFDLIVNKNLALGIENYILEHEIDVISVTAHKRNLLTSLFKPSLTKELLFRLEIPMLIFHA